MAEIHQQIAESEASTTEHEHQQVEQQHFESRCIQWQRAALIVIGLPFILGLCTILQNLEMMGRMIFPNPTQPYGWIMVFIFFAFIGLAYFGIRGSLALFSEKWWPIAVISIFMLCVPPAMAILLLGTAVLTIVEEFADKRPF